jgi:phage tail-like protein
MPSPLPIAAGLPRMYADDEYAGRLTSALDTVLAPALGALDNLTAYLDPGTAPPDFLRWLGRWLAAPLDEMDDATLTTALRSLLPEAASLGARRGTASALVEEVGRVAGVEVDVLDLGGVAWSKTPGGCVPGQPRASVGVRVRGACNQAVVRRLVRRSVPAHVPVVVTFEEEQ